MTTRLVTLETTTSMHFGLRGGKEQRDLKWGDITLKIDYRGKKYLEYSTERQTKTRPGGWRQSCKYEVCEATCIRKS